MSQIVFDHLIFQEEENSNIDSRFIHQLIEIESPDGSKKTHFYSSLPTHSDENKVEIHEYGYILKNKNRESIENSPHFDEDGIISNTDFVNWYTSNHETMFPTKFRKKLNVYHVVSNNGSV